MWIQAHSERQRFYLDLTCGRCTHRAEICLANTEFSPTPPPPPKPLNNAHSCSTSNHAGRLKIAKKSNCWGCGLFAWGMMAIIIPLFCGVVKGVDIRNYVLDNPACDFASHSWKYPTYRRVTSKILSWNIIHDRCWKMPNTGSLVLPNSEILLWR